MSSEKTSQDTNGSEEKVEGGDVVNNTTSNPFIEEVARPIPPLPRKSNSVRRNNSTSRHSLDQSRQPKPSIPRLQRRNTYTPAISSPLNETPLNNLASTIDPEKTGLDETEPVSSSNSNATSDSKRNSTVSANSRNRSGSDESGSKPITARNIGKLRKNPPPGHRQTLPLPLPHKFPVKRTSNVSLASQGRDYDRYPTFTEKEILSGFRPGSSRPMSRILNDASSGEHDPEKVSFYPFIDGEVGADASWSSGGFPLYMDDKEDDDEIHNPVPGDEKRTPLFKGMDRQGAVSFFFFCVFVLGVLMLFIVLPVLTYSGISDLLGRKSTSKIDAWAWVSDEKFSIPSAVRMDMIDPDTPDYAYTRKGVNGDELKLVFSDEFNTDGRTFYEGDDQFWTAPDLHYAATGDYEWYDPDASTTKDGTLRLTLDRHPNHNLDYRSGMLQSWNKMCFKGGVLEVSVSLPGPPGVPAYWPGIWTLGNLARPGYMSTSEGLWPYSYDTCDYGITPNQSMTDGTSYLPGQKLSSCTCFGEDHPNPGTGRGAPEIDVFEASADPQLKLGVVTQSLQVAPFDIYYQPNYDFVEIHNYSVTQMNTYCGGPFQQAISGVTTLNPKWYDGVEYQKYAFEYEAKKDAGFITWFVGDEPTFTMQGQSTGPNGNVKARDISLEPMSIVLNLGFSKNWVNIDFPNLKFPTTMYIDYVRIYQKEGEEMLTCDPPGFPTTGYIKDHPEAYNNWNHTLWDETGYDWPRNTLMHGCKE